MGVLDDITAAQNLSQQIGTNALNDYNNKANDYSNQYNTYRGQADTARGNIDSFNQYMQGAGSAANLYKQAFDQNSAKAGYSQDALTQAQNNVQQAQGAQSAYNDYANTAASKWGMNAGALAASNSQAQSSLNNNIAAASTTLGNQQKAYELAQNQASTQSGQGIQQQQTQLAGYKEAFDTASQQMASAKDNMQFYQSLAQKQGGLNADMYNAYQTSKTNYQKAMADAAAAYAQAQLSISQARQADYATQAAREHNDYMKQYQIGDYARPSTPTGPQSNPSQANPQGGGGFNITNWADGLLNPIASFAQSSGSAVRHMFGL